MKILINTSTLVGSGVTQVAVSFLYECLKLEDKNEYYVFLGKKVNESIQKNDFDERFIFYDFPIKPLSFLRGGIQSVLRMKKLEDSINPDATFTVFGPSWWTPKSPHLQGYAYPHYVYKESPFFDKITFKSRLRIKILEFIHLSFLKKNGHFFVSETEDVSIRFSKLVNRKEDSFFTVSNTCNAFFRDFVKEGTSKSLYFNKDSSCFYFVSLCTLQSHKNLSILNLVIPLLRSRGYLNIRFVLTISKEEVDLVFDENVKQFILPMGRVSPNDCPLLLSTCDALFLPTLLECFTANYPEAMLLKKPILTSDLSFATMLCEDAALYFNPLNAQDVVDKIIAIISNEDLSKQLVSKGENVMKKFLRPDERAIKYLEILKSMSDVRKI